MYAIPKKVLVNTIRYLPYTGTNIREMTRYFYGLCVMCNATLNNVSVISWRSVLLMEEIRVSGENH